MDDMLKLGGKIQLSGFRDLDRNSMVIVKKIVGNYAKRFDSLCKNMENLHLRIKIVHPTEASEKYELSAKVIDNGTPFTAQDVDRNVFVVLDSTLKKIENSLAR